MRRIVIWTCMGFAVAVLLGFAALVVALRRAPDATISQAPLATTYWLRQVTTDAGRELIRERLRKKESAPLVVAGLSGSPAAQRHMIEAISGDTQGGSVWSMTEDVEALLLGLCSYPDEDVRALVRGNFSPDGLGRRWSHHQRRYEHFEPGQMCPGPGTWIPGRPAVLGLVTLTYLGAGYDHRMPSRFRFTVQGLLDLLLAGQDARGCFATDDRDHAIVTMAVAEAYAMTIDQRLHNPVLKALTWLVRDDDLSAEARWSANTDLAVWDLMALKSVQAGGLPNYVGRSKQWMDGNDDLGKRCYEHGQVLDVPPAHVLAQSGVMQGFVGNAPALKGIAEENFTPRAELSDLTNYWLTLALLLQSPYNFRAHIDPYVSHILSEQNWDASDPDIGCLSPLADPASNSLRLLLMGITYHNMPISPSGAPSTP